MSERIAALTAKDLKESEALLEKVHELSSAWNEKSSDTAIDNTGLNQHMADYAEAVDKVYEKLSNNVKKIASSQPKV
ncbi:MAG TPA: hypothetical protein VGK02_05505 [Candidatus Aquicultor sp.]|jgi:hypothetical protein